MACEASVNRTTVPSGGEVVLTVSAHGDVTWTPEFQLPEVPDVRIYAGGTNQSMSMINGTTETSVSRTYYLKVNGSSDFTIGPVTITSGKGSCTTDPITIHVTAATPPPAQIPPANTGNRTPRAGGDVVGSANGSGGNPGDEMFVTLEADHTEAWVGQQIIVTFRYWRRVQPWNNPSYSPPRTEGFWRENLGSEQNSRKVLHGRAYNVTEIRYAIFPTRVGDLVVEPAELSFSRGAFDAFFQTRRNRRNPTTLRTDPITIHVKELPRPMPAGYSGIVASHLKLISQVDRDTIPRGEALGLKVLLNADGFLKGFSDLQVPAPAQARVHDAGESFRTGVESDRLNGHITVEKVIVPDQEGVLHLPPVELVWFDTSVGRFRTARTAAWDVVVTPSGLPTVGADQSGFLRSELSRLGEDLAFIHPVPVSLSRRVGPVTGSGLWWTLLLLPLLLLGGWRVLLARIDADRRDPAGRRLRGALTVARACLSSDEGDPMNVIARAICGYVADCGNRPPASVGPAEVRSFGEELGLPDVAQRLIEILALSDAERYGQSATGSTAPVTTEVADLLAKMDQRCRRKKENRHVAGGSLAVLAIVATSLMLTAAPLAASDRPEDYPGTDPVRLVAEGNQAYTEGRLAEAEAKYLAAREMGVNDAVLHFNLGNTYARSGHLGQAVVCYLRAQRLDPRDRDNKANLAWVRRHIRDLELSGKSLPLFIAQFAGVVGLLTLDQWGVILVVMVWVLAVLIAWGWYREEFLPWLRRALLGAAAVFLVVTAITCGRWYTEEVRDSAVVTVPTVVVRSGPAEDFSALFEVHDGLTLNIDERRPDWVRVGLGGDWEGWIPAASVEPVKQTIPVQGR